MLQRATPHNARAQAAHIVIALHCYTHFTDGTNGQITWATWKNAKALIVPSIANPSLYASAQSTFKNTYGITTSGYVAWNP
jgi:hypothetical protein